VTCTETLLTSATWTKLNHCKELEDQIESTKNKRTKMNQTNKLGD